MDFYKIQTKQNRDKSVTLAPVFQVRKSKDLMVRGGAFYAVWDEDAGLWSTDSYDVRRLVDDDLTKYVAENPPINSFSIAYMLDHNDGVWTQFRKYLKELDNSYHELDMKVTFANTEVKKEDYVSRRLPYAFEEGDHSAWDEMLDTLYDEENRRKIEWAIGSIIAGDSKKLQKFFVFYGAGGTGKSTIMDTMERLFEGYVASFEAKQLVGNNNVFALEAFRSNPLVAIQHDGDMSKINDYSKFNALVSHEPILMNEKFKSGYTTKFNALLFMGSNRPVDTGDSKSGFRRRLIDIHPTGNTFEEEYYHTLKARVMNELGAIAYHCHQVYQNLGFTYYRGYLPKRMMMQTDPFLNFIEANLDVFRGSPYMTLARAWVLYKEFCDDNGERYPMKRQDVREELKAYYDIYKDEAHVDGQHLRGYFEGFKFEREEVQVVGSDKKIFNLDKTESLLDEEFKDMPAQKAIFEEAAGIWRPERKWENNEHTLADLDTRELHYVKVPENHIVIDFDLVDESGAKSQAANLAAIEEWPVTYAEFSKGGAGVHLHYTYGGDVTQLATVYGDGIEIKALLGDASLRRKLTYCNDVPVAPFTGALPLKEKKVLKANTLMSEKGMRELIERNLRKEIHAGTKPSVDFIKKILDDAYDSGMQYDVTDMRNRIMAFATNSSNQALASLKTVSNMKFSSAGNSGETVSDVIDERLVFWDVEVYPNLFVLCWKYQGAPKESIVRMINPTPEQIEMLFKMRLVGFNNRRYDNHILYARHLGYDNLKLYDISQRIINNDRTAMFGNAYSISYTDIYDFSSLKQSLKKFEIDLGVHHMEMNLPWDQPVPEERWEEVADYCCNDVWATEKTFESRQADWNARLILAKLSGLTPNDTTQRHTAQIIFGDDKNASSQFVYTDLSIEFPGYTFDRGVSTYMGEVVGEGGLVRAIPGIYEQVALLDIASMHPTTMDVLQVFGPKYTRRFTELLEARLAIKHKDYETAGSVLDGQLREYLGDPAASKSLAYALKIVINIVYGLTSAKFPNPFKDNRNIDNIVAKRGALFMMDLKAACEEMGIPIVHIKTDSVKIPNATPEIIEDIKKFGEKYGYTFEHEATYDRFCLVNDAVYIARYGWHAEEPDLVGKWTATGAQFAHPYVFKTMFSNEDVEFDDLCETKQVAKGAMYLDREYDRPLPTVDGMQFVGRTGRFVPVVNGGGVLWRVHEDKQYAVAGTKGYYWLEAEMAQTMMDDIEVDISYFENLAENAKNTIEKFGSYADLVKE